VEEGGVRQLDYADQQAIKVDPTKVDKLIDLAVRDVMRLHTGVVCFAR
jgi:hypothetical protein